MPDTAAPTPAAAPASPPVVPAALLEAWPHLPAFWPEGAPPRPGPAGTPLPFDPGPFAPPRLAGREVPVALVFGAPPDPLGAALAAGGVADPALVARTMRALAAARLGGPPGLPDPGPAALGAPRGGAVLLLNPARADAARAAAGQRAVVAARDPFRPGAGPALDPWTLLDAAAELHGASRPLALLALAAGVRVADGPLAGVAPEAAWGALVAATRCADPFRRTPCTLEAALGILALWRARAAQGARVAACLGIHPYKRPRVRELLASAAAPPFFHARPGAALRAARARGGALLAWAASAPPDLPARARAAGVDLLWLEDGFLRSAGLGAAFRPGASFALDARGPHYDPAAGSELDALLDASPGFDAALLARAASLRAAVVARGLTKYNLPGRMPDLPAGRRLVLVPGQVEDDASVRHGALAGSPRGNLALLRAVRAAEPGAAIIYKPHPDLEAGFRRGRIAARDLAGLADVVASGAPMAGLLARVDAVHTLTSLTGFEALLRGLPVTCWGMPFYAGRGLTSDRVAPPRPRAPVTLDGLVAAALILYPHCLDPLTGLPCPPEVLLDRLDRPELFPPGRLALVRAVQGAATRLVARWRGRR